MKLLIFAIFYTFMFTGTVQAENNTVITEISNSVEQVCNKPNNAGTYWDIKVKGDGSAGLRLKQLKALGIGVSGDVEFTQGEWEGIQSTVEDNIDYRDCVKALLPLFVDKFKPVIDSQIESENNKKKRSISGVKKVDVGVGVEMVLQACKRKGVSVVCEMSLTAEDTDCRFDLSSGIIYDQLGKGFKANSSLIANYRGTPKVRVDLVKSVETSFKITFANVDDETNSISKALISAYVCRQGGYDFVFRDVDIGF